MVIFEISNIFARKMRKYFSMDKFIGIGNALVDALYTGVEDNLLHQLELPKGSMQLIDTARFHQITEGMASVRKERTTGGSACNTILALARLGARTEIIGKVGRDENGTFFAKSFEDAGVSLRLISSELPTGVASAFITPDGERTFATCLGAAATMQSKEIKDTWFAGSAYLYIEGYLIQDHELILSTVRKAKAAGLTICLDMASYNVVEAERDFFDTLLGMTDIVFANEEEAKAFCHLPAEEAVRELARYCTVAVVKTGSSGAVGISNHAMAASPAQIVEKVVDTTAAGDYFAAGFLYARMQGRSLEDCLKAGNLLAGEIIQVVGTRLPDETWTRLRKILQ